MDLADVLPFYFGEVDGAVCGALGDCDVIGSCFRERDPLGI